MLTAPEVASPVDDRRLAGHQRRLGDGLLGAAAADRRQRRAAAARSAQGRVRCACRCPSSSSRRRAPSTRRPPRTARASRPAFRGAPTPDKPHPRCSIPAATVRGAAPRVRPPPAPSTCRWTSGRAPRARPGPAARRIAPARPSRRRSAVSDHSVVGAVAIISCESPSAPVSVPVICAQRGQQHRHTFAALHVLPVAELVIPLAGDDQQPAPCSRRARRSGPSRTGPKAHAAS